MNKLALAACVVTLLSVAPALSQNAPPGNPTNTGFMAQQPGDRLASRLVGLNIQNTGNENIGEIYDIILTDAGAVKAYIVSVGGFLGMGTRYVAIDPKAVTLTRQDEKTWKATMNANWREGPALKFQEGGRKAHCVCVCLRCLQNCVLTSFGAETPRC
jgi:sporulation protein YlmC with PRC-barrel domain